MTVQTAEGNPDMQSKTQGQKSKMQVAIHAGAAFTDERRLLISLQKNSNANKEKSVAIVGPRRYRQVFKPAFDALGAAPDDLAQYDRIQGLLPKGPETGRIIFSSANFASELSAAIQDGQLYPLAGRRMAHLQQAYQEHDVEVFMGLVNPGSFIPKLLMSLPEQDRENIVRATDLSCLSWIGMIEDMRDLAPEVKITLWSNEDTPLIWGDIIRAMLGLSGDAAVVDEYDLLLSLLDDTGQNEGRALIGQDGAARSDGLRDALARIFDAHAQQEKVEEELTLPGWNTEIIEAFSELYEQDMERLTTMPGVRVLRP